MNLLIAPGTDMTEQEDTTARDTDGHAVRGALSGCQFITADRTPRRPAAYCGRARTRGSAYCPEHYRICYTAPALRQKRINSRADCASLEGLPTSDRPAQHEGTAKPKHGTHWNGWDR